MNARFTAIALGMLFACSLLSAQTGPAPALEPPPVPGPTPAQAARLAALAPNPATAELLPADFQRDVLKLQRDRLDLENGFVKAKAQYDEYVKQVKEQYDAKTQQLAMKKTIGEATCNKAGKVYDEAAVGCIAPPPPAPPTAPSASGAAPQK